MTFDAAPEQANRGGEVRRMAVLRHAIGATNPLDERVGVEREIKGQTLWFGHLRVVRVRRIKRDRVRDDLDGALELFRKRANYHYPHGKGSMTLWIDAAVATRVAVRCWRVFPDGQSRWTT